MKRKYISQDPDSGQTYPAMQEPQHTPTPWEVVDLGVKKFLSTNTRFEIHRSYPYIGHVALIFGDGTEPKANAEFIVRAVNSHEALLRENEHLKQLVSEFEKQALKLIEMNEGLEKLRESANKETNRWKAIAQAEGNS